jgi:PAS domain S-box-containing protein
LNGRSFGCDPATALQGRIREGSGQKGMANELPGAWSIRKKLLFFLLVIFLPAFGIIAAAGLKSRADAIEKARNDATLVAQSLVAQQELIATTTRTLLTSLAQTSAVRQLDVQACSELLGGLRGRLPVYSAVLAAATPDGNMFAASLPFKPGTINLADRKHIQDALRTRDFSVGEYIQGRVSALQSLNYTLPVLDANGKVIAILIAGYNLHEFRNSLSKVDLPEGYSVTITDWKGDRLFRWPETAETATGIPINPKSLAAVSGVLPYGFFENLSKDGKYRVYAYRQLRLTPASSPYMYVMVGIPQADILRKASRQMMMNLLLLGVSASIAMVLAWFFGDYVLVRPISRLVSATKHLAKGQRNIRTGLRHSADELGQLAQAFDEMAELRDHMLSEIEQRDARFRELAGAIREVFWMYDVGTKQVVYVSPAYEDIWGRSCAQLYAKPEDWLLSVHQEDRPAVRQCFHEGLSAGEFDQTYRIVRPDGAVRWVHDRAFPVRDGVGAITRLAGVAVDITEQRQAQEALIKTERQLAAIVGSSHDAIIGEALDGTVTSWNSGAERIFGYAAEEMLGQNRMILCVDGKESEMAEISARIARGERIEHFETVRRHKNGNAIKVSLSASPIRDEAGSIVGAAKVAHDISKRKQLERELLAAAGRLRVVLESTQAVIMAVDDQWRVTYANKFVNTDDPSSLLGKSLWEIQPELIGTVFETDFRHAVSDRVAVYREAYYSPHKVWYAINAYPSEGGLLLIWRDITEQHTLGEQLRHSQKMEAVGQLAAGIAHEINTPIQYIGDNTTFLRDSWKPVFELLSVAGQMRERLGNQDFARDITSAFDQYAASADLDYLAKEIPQAIAQSLEGVQRVAKIVKAMKEFSHPGSEEKSAVDLNHAIETTITVARNEWKHVALVETCFDPLLPAVPCIPGEFNQVILNLLINAAQAIAEVVGDESNRKGRITISTRRVDGGVEIAVRDDGPGIPEHIRPRIFEPFFTTKAVGKGTGQGLSLAHSTIVKRHGGRIWFDTDGGKGTTFFIQLPLPDGADSERHAAGVSGSGESVRRQTGGNHG